MTKTTTRPPGLYFIGSRDGDWFNIVGFKFDEKGGQIVPAGEVAYEDLKPLMKGPSDNKDPDSIVGHFLWLGDGERWSELLHGTYHVEKRTASGLVLRHLDTGEVFSVSDYRGRQCNYLNFGPAGLVEAKPVAGIEPCTLPRGRVRDLVVEAGLLTK